MQYGCISLFIVGLIVMIDLMGQFILERSVTKQVAEPFCKQIGYQMRTPKYKYPPVPTVCRVCPVIGAFSFSNRRVLFCVAGIPGNRRVLFCVALPSLAR